MALKTRGPALVNMIAFLITVIISFANSQPAYSQTTFYPATGIYNFFLEQVNIIECEYAGNVPINPTVKVFGLDGRLISSLSMRLEPKGTQHVILNDLLRLKDTYGTYRIELSDEELFNGSHLACRTAFYRAAPSDDSKPFEFAYVLPVKNPDSGERSGSFNSFNPSESSNPTYNWLSLVNLDDRAFSAEIFLYSTNGSLVQRIPVNNITPASRIDIPLGHDQGQVVGTYRIIPDDMAQKYQSFVIRYGNHDNKFTFAFPLQSVAGSCNGNLVQLSTMGSPNTANWLEVVNINLIPVPVTINIRDRNGSIVHTERVNLESFAQHHIFANPIIDPDRSGNVGSAQILCEDPTDKIITQALYYGRTPDLKIEWAYASQDFGFSGVKKGSYLTTPINTFLGMANWIKLANSQHSATLGYETFDNAGAILSHGTQHLHSSTTADIGIHGQIPENVIGATFISSDTNRSEFSGELLRIIPDKRGDIGTIIQIPGIVQRKGVNNQITASGQRTTGFIGNAQSLSQYRNNLTYEETHQLLVRTGFGATHEEIVEAQKAGLASTVQNLLGFIDDTSVESEARRYLNNNINLDNNIINHVGTQKYWLYHMIHSPNPLKERMALIWHDLFAASCTVVQDNRINNTCYKMLEVFRENALGNFETIAKKMTRDYVMLRWLNGNSNRKGVPDENYAREFWELFSLGEPTKHKGRFTLYTSEDILESSRAFTGWTTPVPSSQNPDIKPVFVESRFDDGIKTIFAETPFEATGAFNDFDLVERTLARHEAAEWVVKRLFSAFAHDHPGPQIINELSTLLRANGYNTLPVVKKILLSEAAFSTESKRNRAKDAVTFGIGFIRSTGIPVEINRVHTRINNNGLGFQPLYPPSVNGWPLHKYNGAYLTQFFLGWSLNYTNFIREMLTRAPVAQSGFTYNALIPFPLESVVDILGAGERLIDHWSKVLGVNLTTTQREILVEYMNSQRSSNGDVSPVPFNSLNSTHVRQKVPGLLWILAQHEDFKTF